MIAEQNEAVVVERRRAAVAPADFEGPIASSQRSFPQLLSVDSNGHQLPRAEPAEDGSAIRDAARRGQIVFAVNFRKRILCSHGNLPEE